VSIVLSPERGRGSQVVGSEAKRRIVKHYPHEVENYMHQNEFYADYSINHPDSHASDDNIRHISNAYL
jgi:hypothetical protein